MAKNDRRRGYAVGSGSLDELHIFYAVYLAADYPSHRQPFHRSDSDEDQNQLVFEFLKGYH